MAAASAARKLSDGKGRKRESSPTSIYPSLLLCDRTFCNLPAVAQRLVGGWTGHVIPLLTPLWSTDVAGDFINAQCPKIVAQDAADSIIHDSGSLKSGLAIAQERLKGITRNIGLKEDAPLEYRMADWENVGITKSNSVNTFVNFKIQGPSWPSDKHITISEAFHFAACAKRIGKVATSMKKGNQIRAHAKYVTLGYSDEEQGIEIKVLKRSGENELNNDSASHEIKVNEQKMKDLTMEAWRTLACCDGMTGMHCGAAVKQGYDCTVTWLFSAVAFGGQVVASAAQIRNSKSNQNVILSSDELDLSACDFGVLKENQSHADEIVANPIPIPEVVIRLKKIMEESNNLSDGKSCCI